MASTEYTRAGLDEPYIDRSVREPSHRGDWLTYNCSYNLYLKEFQEAGVVFKYNPHYNQNKKYGMLLLRRTPDVSFPRVTKNSR
jgi:hypothetical protein